MTEPDGFAQLLLDRLDGAALATEAFGESTMKTLEAIIGDEHSSDYWDGWATGYKDGIAAVTKGIKDAAHAYLLKTRCPQYWSKIDNRCKLAKGHEGQHHFEDGQVS